MKFRGSPSRSSDATRYGDSIPVCVTRHIAPWDRASSQLRVRRLQADLDFLPLNIFGQRLNRVTDILWEFTLDTSRFSPKPWQHKLFIKRVRYVRSKVKYYAYEESFSIDPPFLRSIQLSFALMDRLFRQTEAGITGLTKSPPKLSTPNE